MKGQGLLILFEVPSGETCCGTLFGISDRSVVLNCFDFEQHWSISQQQKLVQINEKYILIDKGLGSENE
jgi:hypothetical protein